MLIRALIFIVLFCGQQAAAAVLSNLYETEIITQSPSPEDRNIAIKAALSAVLKRVVVLDNRGQQDVVDSVLTRAPQYVKQYQYALQESGLSVNTSSRLMRVLFDERALVAALESGGIKIWGADRPETLLWLVIEENGRRSFFKAEMMPELANAVSLVSKQTGLPLLYPLLDMDEQRLISVNDVLSAYPQRLLSVSERYDVVSILAGRVVKRQSCWESDWAFYFGQGIEQWTKTCGSLNDVLMTGMQGAYGRLSAHYAVSPDAQQTGLVTLAISGANGAGDMKRINRYLNSLAPVKSVFWLGAHAGFNEYRVYFAGEQRALEEILGLGRVLNPLDQSAIEAGKLKFRLISERAK